MSQITYGDCWTYPRSKIDAMFKEVNDKIASVLPEFDTTDNGKVLKVDGTGTKAKLEWATDAT